MFQYAFARKLQLEYDMDMVCDLSKFHFRWLFAPSMTKRDFGLDVFELTDRMKYKHAILPMLYQKLVRYICDKKKLLEAEHYQMLAEKGIFAPNYSFKFYATNRCKSKNMYVINYKFMVHRYFDDILSILRKDFTFKNKPNHEIQELLNIMGGVQQESVCLHWRRGDYLRLERNLHVCKGDYFDSAIDRILEKVKNPVFYLFTNSIEDAKWIKNNHRFKVSINYINLMLNEEHTDLDDFRLMCACKHFIISNSTFSWWAQYLSANESKVVVAPSIWCKVSDASELYQHNWEIVDV